MGRHRDFDASRAENNAEPLTFRLAGYDFVIERVPAGPLLDLAANGDATDAAAMAAFARFLKALVRPADRDQLAAALDDTDLTTVLELVRWVIEESTGRPLDTPLPSPPVASEDGEPSKVVSLSPVSTRSA